MKLTFKKEGIIHISPEDESEVYILWHFIKDFKAGFASIEISKFTCTVSKVNIRVDPKNNKVIIKDCEGENG